MRGLERRDVEGDDMSLSVHKVGKLQRITCDLTVAQDQPKSSSKSSRNGHDRAAKLPTVHPGALAAPPGLNHAIKTLHPTPHPLSQNSTLGSLF